MSEQAFEKTIEDSVNMFGNWAYRYEIIFGGIFSIVFIVIGTILLKRKKKNAGYIFLGIGLLVLILDVIKVIFGLL